MLCVIDALCIVMHVVSCLLDLVTTDSCSILWFLPGDYPKYVHSYMYMMYIYLKPMSMLEASIAGHQ